MQRLLNRLIPFFLLGIAIVAFAFGIMLLAYLFIFGAMVGFVLYIFYWIKAKFVGAKKMPAKFDPEKKGRVIDSDHWKEL